jgi:S1-C subfamily serine protease
VKRSALAAVGVLSVLATALAWPAARPAEAPLTRVLTVTVRAPGAQEAVGSGFVAGPGRVVTVAHLLERGSSVAVRSPGGRARAARAWRIDRRNDLALLAVPGLRGRPLRTADAGDEVRLLLVRDGRAVTRVARVRRLIQAHVEAAPDARPRSRPALELAGRIAAGDSGAPVVSAGGEVAGVLFARSRDHARIAYAVDASALEGPEPLPVKQAASETDP